MKKRGKSLVLIIATHLKSLSRTLSVRRGAREPLSKSPAEITQVRVVINDSHAIFYETREIIRAATRITEFFVKIFEDRVENGSFQTVKGSVKVKNILKEMYRVHEKLKMTGSKNLVDKI